MSRWWRAYDDALDDEKLSFLSDKSFRGWFKLMCLASKNNGVLPPLKNIAFRLRWNEQTTSRLLNELCAGGLLDPVEVPDAPMSYAPHNWETRQYKTDSSAERVKRHREKRAAAGLEAQWTPPKALRKAVYERDNFSCVYCGTTERLSLDHRVPEIRGGTNDIENLATACMACNGAKRDMTETEYREYVTLLKRPQRTDNRTEQISEADASGADAPVDHRKRLFDEGLPKLASLTGKGPDACRSFVGKCLKAAGDDAVTVLGLIEDAERNQVVNPSAWIAARLKPVEMPNGTAQIKTGVVAVARRLAEQFESQLGDGIEGNPNAILRISQG